MALAVFTCITQPMKAGGAGMFSGWSTNGSATLNENYTITFRRLTSAWSQTLGAFCSVSAKLRYSIGGISGDNGGFNPCAICPNELLKAGTYTVTLEGFTPTAEILVVPFTIVDPALDIAITITNIVPETCVAGIFQHNGSAIIQHSGGTSTQTFSLLVAGLTYSITGGSSGSNNITGLSAGTYPMMIAYLLTCNVANPADGRVFIGSCGFQNMPAGNLVIPQDTCATCYLVTPCPQTGGAPFVLQNPTSAPNGNPNTYIGNFFNGSFNVPGMPLQRGCFSLTPYSCSGTTYGTPIAGANFNVVFYAYNTCAECAPVLPSPPPVDPVCWKLSRCDDPTIFFLVNTNQYAIVGYVINGPVLTGCSNNTLPCTVLPEQCWLITQVANQVSPIQLTGYEKLFPDCDCCKEEPC